MACGGPQREVTTRAVPGEQNAPRVHRVRAERLYGQFGQRVDRGGHVVERLGPPPGGRRTDGGGLGAVGRGGRAPGRAAGRTATRPRGPSRGDGPRGLLRRALRRVLDAVAKAAAAVFDGGDRVALGGQVRGERGDVASVVGRAPGTSVQEGEKRS